tara:strand:+ start:85 stop:279 length:195 start_codon:yes stop_codon:yes gene_type:complete
MTINSFIKNYHSVIDLPLVEGRKVGFELSNGVRWYFSNINLSNKSKGLLKNRYRKLGLLNERKK